MKDGAKDIPLGAGSSRSAICSARVMRERCFGGAMLLCSASSMVDTCLSYRPYFFRHGRARVKFPRRGGSSDRRGQVVPGGESASSIPHLALRVRRSSSGARGRYIYIYLSINKPSPCLRTGGSSRRSGRCGMIIRWYVPSLSYQSYQLYRSNANDYCRASRAPAPRPPSPAAAGSPRSARSAM